MATFKPAHARKGQTACLDTTITNALFDCFATTGLYKGQTVEVTVDKESITFTDGEFEIGGMETVICFKACQVPNPCADEEVCVQGDTFLIDKTLHNDGVCICVTVKKCRDC